MKLNFPKNIEWILNRYIYNYGKNKGKAVYQFECFEHGTPAEIIFKCEAKTLEVMAKKIEKFLTKLNKHK